MQIRRHGHHQHWQAIAVLGAGLVVVLTAGSATGAGGRTTWAEPVVAIAPAVTTPADLAVRFQALLGQHSVLAADLMRSRIRGDDNFVQAANAALGENTDAMAALVGQLFGTATAKKFAPMWSEHIVELFAYAGALADQDEDAKADAREELEEYEGDLAEFFSGASHGRLPLAAAREAVKMHVSHLTGQADEYAAHNYASADSLYRESYQHTYDLGLTLADALLPAGQRAVLKTPVWRLRSQLGKLLAEHVVVVEDVTRAAVTNTPDFDAAAEMINGNTGDLTAAIATLFGSAAAQQFQSLWASHVEQLVAYGAATAKQDAAGKEKARTALHSFETGMGAFLAGATGGRISTADLSAAMVMHDQMLLEHADAYAAKDYAKAHAVEQQTYDHMFELARQLADAFGASVAAKLPKGAAQTGYGGMADVVERD